MEASQRFLRRLHLMKNMDMWLREAKYHRDNDDAEDMTAVIEVWKWDEEEGRGKIS